jgi:hypothetical protein
MSVLRGVGVGGVWGEVGGFWRNGLMTKKGIHNNLAGDLVLVLTSFAA